MLKINKDLHISFVFENNLGQEGSIFFDFVDKRRFDAIAPVLGRFYSIIKEGSLHPDVLVVDWVNLFPNDLKAINGFIESLFNKGEIIIDNTLIDLSQSPKTLKTELEKSGIDEDVMNVIKGMTLFICALLRYTTAQSLKDVEGLFCMHKDVQEWRSLHISLAESSTKEAKNSLEKI